MNYERRLIIRFSVIGLGVTLVVATLLSYILERVLVEDALDVTTAIAGDHVGTAFRHVLTPGDLSGPLSPAIYRRVDDIVRKDLLERDIVRVKIWSLDKKLLYSDDHLNIGTPSGVNEELDEALEGEIGRELSPLEKSENAAERKWGSLLEVYVPLRVAGSPKVLGAFEVYQKTDMLDSRTKSIRRLVVTGVFSGFGLLYLGLFSVILGAARRLVARSRENQRLALEVSGAYEQTIEGWAKALELKDHETEGHSRRVVELTVTIAREMGYTGVELANIRRGAILHDIGKMGVPDSILKKTGPLDDDEWAIMKQHPEYSRRVIEEIGYLTPALDIPLNHHEKWDGTGYLKGLSGEEIPLPARIFAIVDVWDALTNDRCYRSAWPAQKAVDYVSEQAGAHFDPAVVRTFLRLMDTSEIKEPEVPG